MGLSCPFYWGSDTPSGSLFILLKEHVATRAARCVAHCKALDAGFTSVREVGELDVTLQS